MNNDDGSGRRVASDVGTQIPRLRRQFSVIVVSRALGSVLQALVGVGLARSIAPDGYGLITGFSGVVLFWLVVCDLGVSSYVGRARALGDDRQVSTALFMNLVTTATSSGIAIVAAVVLDGAWAWALSLIVLGLALDKNVDTAIGVFIADGEDRYPASSVLVRRLVTATSFYVLLLSSVDAVWAYATASALGPIVGQLHLRRHVSLSGVGYRRDSSVLTVLRGSVAFAINDVSMQSRGLDVAVVGVAVSPLAAGLYAAAAKLTAPFGLVSSTLASVMLPRASRASLASVRRMSLRLTLLAFALLVPASVGALFSEWIVGAVVGEAYLPAAFALGVMILALPFVAMASPLAALLQGVGRAGHVAINGVIFALVTLVAILGGGIIAGITGAAAGFAVVSVLRTLVLSGVLLSMRACDQ